MAVDILYEDKYFQITNPKLPANCSKDGGHLMLIKKEKVTDRSDMTYQEAIDFMRISMIVGKAMYEVRDALRVKIQVPSINATTDASFTFLLLETKMMLKIIGKVKTKYAPRS